MKTRAFTRPDPPACNTVGAPGPARPPTEKVDKPSGKGKKSPSSARLVVVAGSGFTKDQFVQNIPSNLDLLLNIVDVLAQDESLMAIRSKSRIKRPLRVSEKTNVTLIQAAVILLPPLLFVGCLHLTEGTRVQEDAVPLAQLGVDRLTRVRLGGRGPRDRASLSVLGPFTLSDVATGQVLSESGSGCSGIVVRAASGGGVYVGDMSFGSSDVLLTPKRDASIVLDDRTYRGRLRIQRAAEGVHSAGKPPAAEKEQIQAKLGSDLARVLARLDGRLTRVREIARQAGVSLNGVLELPILPMD